MNQFFRNCAFVAFCLAAPDLAWGQVVVSGKVFSSAGEPVAGAQVFFQCPDRHEAESKKADANGVYELDRALPGGPCSVRVSADGFDPIARVADLPSVGTARNDFILKERQFLVTWGQRKGLDLTLIQPGTFTFFDTGVDDADEIDLFEDGKLTATVQLLGLDAVLWSDRQHRIRLGINGGFGLASAKEAAPTPTDAKATKTVGAALISASAFLDFAKVARLEFGMIRGQSAGEGGATRDRDDSAFFVGLSLRTQLGNELMKIFR